MPKKNIIIVIVIAALVIVGYFFTAEKDVAPLQIEADSPEEVDTLPEPVYQHETPTEDEIVEQKEPDVTIVGPPNIIDNSDPQVLLAIAEFAPKLSAWLLPSEQIRKWVLAIDLMADGNLPKRYRPIDYPMDAFAITKQEDSIKTAETNFQRANDILNVVTAIDPKTLARYYKEWLPILEKAYREQGKPDTFNQRFRQTISQVLAATPLDTKPELIRPGVFYQYADERLEKASEVEKLLWRMGENNTERLQSYLRDLRFEIEYSSN